MPVCKQRMAQIRIKVFCSHFISFRSISLILLFLVAISSLFSQTAADDKPGMRKVELIHADFYSPDKKLGRELGRFIGNVAFKHNDIIMTCDSAYFYQNKNQLKAFSRVHVEQGDTLDLYGDYLFYDGTNEIANMEGNVELIDNKTHLFTRTIEYNVSKKIARYPEKGRITDEKNTLVSMHGTYNVNEKMFHFKDSIKITNPDYVMTADTMDYNSETETVYFTGPSELNGDSLYLYCERGWYDTKNELSRIWKNAVIDNRQQVIKGDSLFYDGNKKFGQAFNNVTITDTTNKIIIGGNFAWYYKDPEQFMATDSAVFIQISKNDSLYLHADTISAKSVTDTTGRSFRLMRAYKGCRIFSADLQAKCDSLAYSFQDSVIRMYYSPVLWSEENQLTADSIAIFTKNRQADRMELYNTAFVTSKFDSVRFNQIKGRKLTGYFINNKLTRIEVEGNGESVYYLDDKGKLVGVTHNKSSTIEIIVEKGKIKKITERQNPDGKLDPPLLNPPEMMKLPGFNWFNEIRPKKVSDIYEK
jgi:lipopolysaccharide export system protein LptA